MYHDHQLILSPTMNKAARAASLLLLVVRPFSPAFVPSIPLLLRGGARTVVSATTSSSTSSYDDELMKELDLIHNWNVLPAAWNTKKW
jgi:hypothetical protein